MRGIAIHLGLLPAGALMASACDGDKPAPGATFDAADRDRDGGDDGCRALFDGAPLSAAWTMSTIRNQPGRDDPGRFDLVDGALVAMPGTDIGLLWHGEPLPDDYVLELEWRQSAAADNSGVFVRFPHLDSRGYDNTAFVAVDFGFEVQIDNRGRPDGAPEHTTGAIYGELEQSFSLVPPLPVGEWNSYRIRVEGQRYTVELNGTRTTQFDNPYADRGTEAPAFMGLQTHTGQVSFRAVRVCPLDEA